MPRIKERKTCPRCGAPATAKLDGCWHQRAFRGLGNTGPECVLCRRESHTLYAGDICPDCFFEATGNTEGRKP